MRITTFILALISSLFLAQCKDKSPQKILIVTSNQKTYGDTELKTYNHFAEIIEAYDVFITNDFEVDFVSPNGGIIPIGYITKSNPLQKKYLSNDEFINRLKNTKHPDEVTPSDYAAIYFSGGGAAMFGVPENPKIITIAEAIYQQNGIVSAVCHGTAGIANLKNKDDKPLYQNRPITGYPNIFEDMEGAYFKTFPFSVEDKIKEYQGNFQYAKDRNANFFIVDGQLITGQDASSTMSVAKEVVKAINGESK